MLGLTRAAVSKKKIHFNVNQRDYAHNTAKFALFHTGIPFLRYTAAFTRLLTLKIIAF